MDENVINSPMNTDLEKQTVSSNALSYLITLSHHYAFFCECTALHKWISRIMQMIIYLSFIKAHLSFKDPHVDLFYYNLEMFTTLCKLLSILSHLPSLPAFSGWYPWVTVFSSSVSSHCCTSVAQDVPAVKGLNESRIELLARVQNLKKVVISLPLQVQHKMLSVEDFEQSESKSVASCVLCYQPLKSLSVHYSLLDLLSAACYNMIGAIRCLTL